MKKKLLIAASLLIAAVSSNAQIINADFSTWSADFGNSAAMDPNSGLGSTGWWDLNLLSGASFGASAVQVSRDNTVVMSGSTYSAKITSVALTSTSQSLSGSADTVGLMFTGNISAGSSIKVTAGEPFSQRINQLYFWYQYQPNGVDTAWCIVSLSHYSNGVSNVLGGAELLIVGKNTSWMQAQMPIQWDSTSGNPDTITIEFSSCNLNTGAGYLPKPGSILWVDNVTTTVTGIDEVSANSVKVNAYPNPASTEINFTVSGQQASLANIYDITGQKVGSYTVDNNFLTVNTAGFASGSYICQIYDKAGSLLNVNKFTVSK